MNKAISLKKKLVINILLLVGLFVTTICLGWDSYLNWLIYLSVAAGIVSSFLGNEGYWVSYIFNIISYGIYVPFCIIENYYGELIVSCIVIIVSFFVLLKWKKHTSNKTVKINIMGIKETTVSIAVLVVITIIFGIIMQAIGTKYAFLNALCIICTVFGFYFDYRISRNRYIVALTQNVAMLTLWVLAATTGNLGYLLFSIGGIIEIFYDIHGYYNWGKLYKKQKKENPTLPYKTL